MHAKCIVVTKTIERIVKGIKRSTYDEEKTPASSTQTLVASLPNRIFSMMALHCQENILDLWASKMYLCFSWKH
jgi:hypothetical protein